LPHLPKVNNSHLKGYGPKRHRTRFKGNQIGTALIELSNIVVRKFPSPSRLKHFYGANAALSLTMERAHALPPDPVAAGGSAADAAGSALR
jgi:hypothetical protein